MPAERPLGVPPARHLQFLYRYHFRDSRRERLFLSSVSFFTTFAAVRMITHSIRGGHSHFRNITPHGKHLHHLIWGIALLLLVGYVWLAQVGVGLAGADRGKRLTALGYGAGSALTLDEFALWLNLQDVYWTPQGRESIDAVMLFGGLLSSGFWGGPFLRALTRFLTSEARRLRC